MAGNDLNQTGLKEAEDELWGNHIDHEGLSISYEEAVLRVVTVYMNRAQPELHSESELDALPVGSCVRGWDGFKHVKVEDNQWILCVAVTSVPHETSSIELPARVLYRG